MRSKIKLLAAVVGMAILAGCKDEAAEWLRRCEDAESRGDIDNAWTHCSISADKGSAAAKKKLEQLKPTYEKLKSEEAAKAAEKRAKADKEFEERRKAEQAAQAARIEKLRERVRRSYRDGEPDTTCTGKGLPPFMWSYEGGTFAENAEVAAADGCRAPYSYSENTTYCCPKKPVTWP